MKRTSTDEPTKTRTQSSIDYAFCPKHTSDGTGRHGGMTGLIAVDRHTVAFREHTKRVGNVTMRCPGSGEIYDRKGFDG